MHHMFSKFLSAFTLVLVLTLPGLSVAAQTQWQDIGGGKARLLATKDPETDAINAIVDIRLDEGWKTYWLAPGNSGIPPEFDFSRSENFSAGSIAFPIPTRIALSDTEFYGYKDKVAFVFQGEALKTDTSLGLDLLIGVCEEICIPATASFSISAAELNRSDAKTNIAIMLARSFLPSPPSEALRMTDLKLDDAILSGRVDGTELSGNEQVAVEIPGVWVSDPLPLKKGIDDNWQFSTRVPSVVTGIKDGPITWQYSILQPSTDDREIKRAVSGEISIRPQ